MKTVKTVLALLGAIASAYVVSNGNVQLGIYLILCSMFVLSLPENA